MRFRIAKVLTLVGLSMVLLAGCGKKQDADEYWHEQYKLAWNQNTVLLQNQNGSGTLNQPTDLFQLNINDSMIVFPEEFGYPNALPGVPTYTVNFNTGDCSLVPPKGWEVSAKDNILYVYNGVHMVYGQFIPGVVDTQSGSEAASTDVLQSYLESWFKTTQGTYKFSTIYLGDQSKSGVRGQCIAEADGQSVVLNCGLISDGKTTMTYMFTYLGAENQAKEEAIQSIVSNCYVGGKQIKIM